MSVFGSVTTIRLVVDSGSVDKAKVVSAEHGRKAKEAACLRGSEGLDCSTSAACEAAKARTWRRARRTGRTVADVLRADRTRTWYMERGSSFAQGGCRRMTIGVGDEQGVVRKGG